MKRGASDVISATILYRVTHCVRSLSELAAIFLAIGLLGCQPAPIAPQKPAGTPRHNKSVDVLFTTVVEQLRDLPSYVDVDLRPPTVVLDAKTSADGQDVMATSGMAPSVEDGPINC